MSGPSIAVIVPNRNDARFLPRCLRSVLDQAAPPDELIVVDDQSTDDSVAVIRSITAGTPYAHLVVNAVNLGTNGAMNEGLNRSRSDYALFLSANDFVLPGIFARARHGLARAGSAGVWSAMSWLVDEEDRAVRLHPSPVVALSDAFLPPERCIRLARRFGNWFTGSTLIYRRTALDAVGRFDAQYGAPADLFTALTIASLHGAAYAPEPYAAIRLHTGSYSARNLNDIAAIEAMLERLRRRGPALSPRLFDEVFCERTATRFRFAVIRASGGKAVAGVAERAGGWRSAALHFLAKVVPETLAPVRIVAAFVVLRPFDILPTLVNRCGGWAVVRLRLLLRGQGAP